MVGWWTHRKQIKFSFTLLRTWFWEIWSFCVCVCVWQCLPKFFGRRTVSVSKNMDKHLRRIKLLCCICFWSLPLLGPYHDVATASFLPCAWKSRFLCADVKGRLFFRARRTKVDSISRGRDANLIITAPFLKSLLWKPERQPVAFYFRCFFSYLVLFQFMWILRTVLNDVWFRLGNFRLQTSVKSDLPSSLSYGGRKIAPNLSSFTVKDRRKMERPKGSKTAKNLSIYNWKHSSPFRFYTTGTLMQLLLHYTVFY